MGKNTIRPHLKSQREYELKNYMWKRVKDLYRYYINSIEIECKTENLKEFFNNLPIIDIKKKIIDNFFKASFFKKYLVITDGYFDQSIKKDQYLKFNRLYRYNDFLNKKTKLDALIYSFSFFNSKNEVKNFHFSRRIKIDFQGENETFCNYIENACSQYERAILSAGFVLDHNNHTIIKLGASENLAGDYKFNSSLLYFLDNNNRIKNVESLNNQLKDTLVVDQYGISFLGTEDEIVRLNTTFATDSYKAIKENLIAKCNIPYSILFGSSTSEDETANFINFYNNINNFFKRYIEPFLNEIFNRIGLSQENYKFKYLFYEDTNFKNKRLEILNKSLDILNKLDNENSSQKVNELKEKVLTSIEDLL